MRVRHMFFGLTLVCLASTGAAYAQTGDGAAAKPADAKPADGDATPTDAKPDEGEATPEDGDAKPTDGADGKAPDGDKPTATAPPPDAVDGSTFIVRLRDLHTRVDDLKERIRRSHTRLSLLSDTILSGGVGGSKAKITFVNDMSRAFKLTSALVVLDGAVQYNKTDDSGALAKQRSIPIFSGSIPPGDHTIQISLKFRGHGYGVFSYLRGYRFNVKSSHSFTVTEGKAVELNAVAFEKGGVTTPLEQRPTIRFAKRFMNVDAAGGSSKRPPASGSVKRTPSGVKGNISIGGGR